MAASCGELNEGRNVHRADRGVNDIEAAHLRRRMETTASDPIQYSRQDPRRRDPSRLRCQRRTCREFHPVPEHQPSEAPFPFIDEHLLIAEKPAGLLAVPGRGEIGRVCLSARVQEQVADALIVHRLDMGTSGLMVFARGLPALRKLSLAFEQRRVSKRYVAVVDGWLDDDEGQIDAPLIADWQARPRQIIDHEIGKPSLTLWRVLAREPERRTRLELTPVTGRSHQLRVHLASIGHPILGDGLYAAPAITEAAPRMLLHASALRVPHPVDGREMAFESPVPF